jgi:hypothetical protein
MRFIIIFAIVFLLGNQAVISQIFDGIFMSYSRIDSTRRGEWSMEVDNLTFFKNNECNSSFQKGYTLPGFWLQIKSLYQPFDNLRIETGAHSLWFWGTNRYPGHVYKELATLNETENSQKVHVAPYLRAHLKISDHLNFVMGNIYGGANHRLIEPLYNPELNLTSDPENGMQLLFNSKVLDLDLWLDWQSFIFKNDTHHEVFLSGFSSKVKVNDENSKFHVYFPVQNLIRHEGGEINTLHGVYTTVNSSAGAGIRYNTAANVLKYMSLEFDFLFNKNPRNAENLSYEGRGYYGKLAFQIKNFNISTSYWKSDNFTPMYGNPFYGSTSYKHEGMYFYKPSMLHFLADYVYPIGKSFELGINAEIFCFLSGYLYSPGSEERFPFTLENNRNFSTGVYLRMNPEFLLKKFR